MLKEVNPRWYRDTLFQNYYVEAVYEPLLQERIFPRGSWVVDSPRKKGDSYVAEKTTFSHEIVMYWDLTQITLHFYATDGTVVTIDSDHTIFSCHYEPRHKRRLMSFLQVCEKLDNNQLKQILTRKKTLDDVILQTD